MTSALNIDELTTTLFKLVDFEQCDTPEDQVHTMALDALLSRYEDTGQTLPEPAFLAKQAITVINVAVEQENQSRLERKIRRAVSQGHDPAKIRITPGDRLYGLRALNPSAIAYLIAHTRDVITIAPSGTLSNPDYDLLAIYDNDRSSPSFGTYLTSDAVIAQLARKFNRKLDMRETKEVISQLKSLSERRTRDTNRDLIAVNNGIIDYKTKKLIPFSPEHIFLAKAAVNYNPAATNPLYVHDDGSLWDVESWMDELTDSAEMSTLLWQIIGATLRPHVSWNKSAWFYSEQGNNGKGSLIELMRNLVGANSYTSIPLSDFSKEFALEPLTRASAILVDENDVGTFIDKAANLKAIITGDVISINRKYQTPISYQFKGFMVQCLNEFPKIKDKSESFYRRQLFVPFNKCFTGAERRYIKDDYLKRQEVLEYVLYRVMNMDDYYTFTEPEQTQDALNEYKSFNDPVRAMWLDMENRFAWELLPYPFLYDLYKAWMNDTMPSSAPLGRNTFIKDLIAACALQPGTALDSYLGAETTYLHLMNKWVALSTQTKVSAKDRITNPEPLVRAYDLEKWSNPSAPAASAQRCIPRRTDKLYSGLMRGDKWLEYYLGADNVQLIESARENDPTATFSFDPDTKTVTKVTAVATKTITPHVPTTAPSPIAPRIDADEAMAEVIADNERAAAIPPADTTGASLNYNPLATAHEETEEDFLESLAAEADAEDRARADESADDAADDADSTDTAKPAATKKTHSRPATIIDLPEELADDEPFTPLSFITDVADDTDTDNDTDTVTETVNNTVNNTDNDSDSEPKSVTDSDSDTATVTSIDSARHSDVADNTATNTETNTDNDTHTVTDNSHSDNDSDD